MHSDDKYTLKPTLAEKFSGIVWKIEADHSRTVVAVETRDLANHKATYSAFDYKTGKCLFKEETVQEGWNWGLDRVYEGTVFLHSYATDQSPEHKGIIAIAPDGKIKWQQFNKALYDISNEGLITYNTLIQPRMMELQSAETGLTIKSSVKDYQPVYADIVLPEISADYALLPGYKSLSLKGPLSYCSINNKDCYVFHIQEDAGFIQKLLILENGNIILEENLTGIIQKLNPEAFFIVQEHLFCIRADKHEIVSYLL